MKVIGFLKTDSNLNVILFLGRLRAVSLPSWIVEWKEHADEHENRLPHENMTRACWAASVSPTRALHFSTRQDIFALFIKQRNAIAREMIIFLGGYQKLRVHSFGMARMRNSDWKSLGLWCIKATDESTLDKDPSVPLMHHDPTDLGSLILIWIISKERTLNHWVCFSGTVGENMGMLDNAKLLTRGWLIEL